MSNILMHLSENREIDHKEDEVLMKQNEMKVCIGTSYPAPYDLEITDEVTGEVTVLKPMFWRAEDESAYFVAWVQFSIEHQLVMHRKYTFKIKDWDSDVKWEATLWTSPIYELSPLKK